MGPYLSLEPDLAFVVVQNHPKGKSGEGRQQGENVAHHGGNKIMPAGTEEEAWEEEKVVGYALGAFDSQAFHQEVQRDYLPAIR